MWRGIESAHCVICALNYNYYLQVEVKMLAKHSAG